MTRPALQYVSRVCLGQTGKAVRAASYLLLALVMLARALVPSGFMPISGGNST
ncbi:MAG TPA: hypothetical protein PLN33_05405 [Hyphomonadaceae bacterium]|jgi:hypothetical protein|nr:hypothetical protein [Hyphomonadaceae bacterium]